MPLPYYPTPDRPHAYLQGRSIPLGEVEKRWHIAGVPGHHVDEQGRIWRAPYTDGSGHQRRGREVRKRVVSGTSHFRFFINGRILWLSQRKIKALLHPAHPAATPTAQAA